jgi:hypothetical protein
MIRPAGAIGVAFPAGGIGGAFKEAVLESDDSRPWVSIAVHTNF